MKLMSMKQYGKMTKASLVRKIMKALKKLPKTKLAKLCYELEKKRLPTLSKKDKAWVKRNTTPFISARELEANPKLLAKTRRMLRKTDVGRKIYRQKPRSAKFPLQPTLIYRQKPRSAKQRANDKRLGRMAKERAKAKRSVQAMIDYERKRRRR